MTSSFERVTVDVGALQLDISNSRIDQVFDQESAIDSIVEDQGMKLADLARSVAERGLNPAEPWIVVNEDERFVVLEGNRRVTVLKLLADPSLSKDLQLQAKLLEISRKHGKGPHKVDCALAPSRDEAHYWIGLLHDTQQGGKARQRWSSIQSNRHSRKPSTDVDKAVRFAVFAEDFLGDDPAAQADLIKAMKERPTTLGRIIGDPDVRNDIGITLGPDGVSASHAKEEVAPIVRRIIGDAANGITVTDVHTKKKRQQYVNEVLGEIPRPRTRVVKEIPTVLNVGASNELPLEVSPARPPRKSQRDERVIFERVSLGSLSVGTQQVLRSTRLLPIVDNARICALLIRIIVELAATEVGVTQGWCKEGDAFRDKIRKCILGLDPAAENPLKRDKRYEQLWLSAQKNSDDPSLSELHMYVHNPVAVADTGTVLRRSAMAGPFLQALNDTFGRR
ncbi:hypothetical protein ACFRCR_15030 [Oerskovia sp. NPDC056781]|uniref:hypothetical protein n=1 Tax=Oerskovia sp. NPDC056781 TaxID=3345942 RepID=UPI00366F2499